MHPAERYKRLLRAYGIPQAQAAGALGRSTSDLNALLNGYRPLPGDVQSGLQKLIDEAANKAPVLAAELARGRRR